MCVCVCVCVQVVASLSVSWCNEVTQAALVEVYLSANTTQSWEGTLPGVREVFGYFPSGLVQWYVSASTLEGTARVVDSVLSA